MTINAPPRLVAGLATAVVALLLTHAGAMAAGSTKPVSPATLADRPYSCPVPSGFVARDWPYVAGGVGPARNRDYYVDQATKKRGARVSAYKAPSRELIAVVPEVLHPEWPESVTLQQAMAARRRVQFAVEFEQWQPCLARDAWQALLDDYAVKRAAEQAARSAWEARQRSGGTDA